MRCSLLCFVLAAAVAAPAAAQTPQTPWKGENLQFFPNDLVAGKYNFDEWEINELARRLTEAGNTAAAIAILEMNGEFYPKSADIDFTLAELHRGRGEKGKAIERYRATLSKAPNHPGGKRWLSELTKQDAAPARMQAWSKALGAECTHCHVEGQWADASKPTFAFAQRMMRMVDGLNAGPLKDLGGVTCWTCHRGRSIPARLARDAWEKIRADHAADFEAAPNRAIAMSVYAASLGVDCSHCHEDDRKANTKAPKAMVARMLPIFEEIPKHFDDTRRPGTQCYMCHQGKTKPER